MQCWNTYRCKLIFLSVVCNLLTGPILVYGAEEHGSTYPEVPFDPQKFIDHAVVKDEQGRLLPWTSYDNVLNWSMKYITDGPRHRTKYGFGSLRRQLNSRSRRSRYLIMVRLQKHRRNQGANGSRSRSRFLSPNPWLLSWLTSWILC